MKNSKRMLAVIAATGLALGAMPGVANAQTADPAGSSVLGLNLDLLEILGVDLAVDLGSAEAGTGEPTGLLGSLEGFGGTGSDDLGSDQLGTGSDDLGSDQLGTGSDDLGSDDAGSDDLGSDDAGSDDLGSDDAGSDDAGSDNAGSDEDGTLDLGSLAPIAGSVDEDGEPIDFLGSVENLFGSGSDDLEGSLEEIVTGSDFGSDDLGSDQLGTGSENLGTGSDEIIDAIGTGSSNVGSGDVNVEGSLDSQDIMTLGSLAGAGIAIGLAVSGGVTLPPLPEVNLGFVCQFPQEAIDFLKNNGSMDRDECLPEDQQN